MPEGPEVKRVAEGLQALEGKTIKQALVVSGRYVRGMVHDIERLNGTRLEQLSVKGKLIVFHLRSHEPFAVLSTLGMTGWWVVLKEKDHEWDKYRRIELQFDDGTVAAFFDPRNFGTFRVVSFAESKRKQAELGPDILTPKELWASIALPDFIKRVRRFGKNMELAETLLDQRIVSGCGNYIRADAMYLARFSPHRVVAAMRDDELKKIWVAMHTIAAHSFLDKEPPTEFGKEPNDGTFINICYGREMTPTGGKVESFSDSNGRTVWYSPEEQT